MKSLMKYAVAFALLAGSTVALADLSCEDLVGDWSGAFGPFTSVTTHITHVDDVYQLEIQYAEGPSKSDGAHASGTCSMSSGAAQAVFHTDIPGIGSVDFTTTLLSDSQLHLVGSMPFADPFDGDLNKQQ